MSVRTSAAPSAIVAALAVLAACSQPARLVRSDADRVLVPRSSALANPADSGRFAVDSFLYGSGTDRRRAAYRDSVTVRTRAVNAAPFLRDYEGRAARRRWRTWGFEPGALPLNARVWYPKGLGRFPLVLVVHGNHSPDDYSEPGYAWLGRHLASRGFIVASLDENFLNGDMRGENDARAFLVLKHAEAWRAIADDPASPVRGRVNLDRIALVGHSRGGEAVATAVAFNRLRHWPDDARIRLGFDLPIRAVLAISPVDGQYRPADRLPPIRGVHYLVVHGSHDGDVSTFIGQRAFLRADVSDSGLTKSSLYVYRANHGQFNTVWGDRDNGGFSFLLRRSSLLAGEEQRQVGRVVFTAFLEMALAGRSEYAAILRDHRAAAAWLPPTMYSSNYADWRDRPLATYEEDLDVTTATAAGTSIAAEGLATWREASLRGRASGRPSLETHGVVLGWTARRDTTQPVPPAWYEIAVSRDRGALRDAGGLTFEFANLALTPSELAPADTLAPRAVGDSAAPVTPVSRRARRPAARGPDTSADTLPPRVTVALRLADGREAQLALDEGAVVRRPLTISLYKWKWVEKRAVGDGRAHEHVLQRAEFPLERFAQALPGFDPAQVVAIRFRFDRRHAGTIFVDNVGVVAR